MGASKAERKQRTPLSCAPCRTRKLKCNREHPCQNCLVRKEPSACIFSKTSSGITRKSRGNGVQNRIDRLESLVTSLLGQSGHEASDISSSRIRVGSDSGISTHDYEPVTKSTGTDYDQVEHGMGTMKVNEQSSIYRGATHWDDVLKELHDLKKEWNQVQGAQFDNDVVQMSSSETTHGPSMLCGPVKTIELPELLATLPGKPAVDKLIAKFFHPSSIPIKLLLHQPTFMEQYEEHWKSPSKTEKMWLALLFAMLTQAMLYYHELGDEPPEYQGISGSLADLYRLRTAQCLMMADITKCAPYTVETLILNVMAEKSRQKYNDAGIWMMVGVVVRAAVQMGYHRDPSHFPEIDVVKGEMRRRLWFFVIQFDAFSSFQVGLPSMVRSYEYDTQEPRNIYDWELVRGMTKLPESRPTSEDTPVLHLIAKSRLLMALGKVIDSLSSLKLDNYDAILEVDDYLNWAHEEIPVHLKFQREGLYNGVGKDVIPRAERIIQIEYMYHQAVSLLHRKFLASSRHNKRFERSRIRCISSAIGLLVLQDTLYEGVKMTGRLHDSQWYRVSVTSREFIFAAMILCLELRRIKNEDNNAFVNANAETKSMLASLHGTYEIWNEVKSSSTEAAEVYKVLSKMLQVLGMESQVVSHTPITTPTTTTNATYISEPWMTNEENEFPITDAHWAAWDSFIEGANFEDVYQGMPFADMNFDFNANLGTA